MFAASEYKQTREEPLPTVLNMIMHRGGGCVIVAPAVVPVQVDRSGAVRTGAEFELGGGVTALADNTLCRVERDSDAKGGHIQRFDPFGSGIHSVSLPFGYQHASSPVAVGSGCWVSHSKAVSSVDFSADEPVVSAAADTSYDIALLTSDRIQTVVGIPDRLPGSVLVLRVDTRGHVTRKFEAWMATDGFERPVHAVFDAGRLLILSNLSEPQIGLAETAGIAPYEQRLSMWQLEKNRLQIISSHKHVNPSKPPMYWPWTDLTVSGNRALMCSGGIRLYAMPLPFDQLTEPTLVGNTGRCLGVETEGEWIYVLGSDGYQSTEKFYLFRGVVDGNQFRANSRFEVAPSMRELMR